MDDPSTDDALLASVLRRLLIDDPDGPAIFNSWDAEHGADGTGTIGLDGAVHGLTAEECAALVRAGFVFRND